MSREQWKQREAARAEHVLELHDRRVLVQERMFSAYAAGKVEQARRWESEDQRLSLALLRAEQIEIKRLGQVHDGRA